MPCARDAIENRRLLCEVVCVSGRGISSGFTFRTAGWFAPVALILIRLLQGLAIGGEDGGAAVYVAEHVPENKRGYYTSYIQVAALLGMFISLAAVIATQQSMSTAKFQQWGWRLPFLASLILVVLSLYVRVRMKESPLFLQLKSAGMHSLQPLTDAFTHWPNLKQVLVSLFGALAGQGVVSYTGLFYALFYMQNILRVNTRTANILVAIGLLIGAPLFPVFGALSDRIGRKKLIMTGLFIAVFTLIPIYRGMQHAAGNNVVAVSSVKDGVTGDIHLTPLTRDESTGRLVPAPEASNINAPLLVLLVIVQVTLACLVYGPIAAYLVEAFPAKVRYTSMSLPYHIGNGVFGGMLPFLALLICASTGNIYAGLYYPIAVSAITFVVGSLLLKETRGTLIWKELEPAKESAT